jgi:hypothetical protein
MNELVILQMSREGFSILQRLLVKTHGLDFNEAKQVLEFVNICGGQGLVTTEEYQKEVIAKYEAGKEKI